MGSKFLPEEQAEVDRLFGVLSSNKGGTAARTFSLEALKARDRVVGHLGSAGALSTNKLVLVTGPWFDIVYSMTVSQLCPCRVESSHGPWMNNTPTLFFGV